MNFISQKLFCIMIMSARRTRFPPLTSVHLADRDYYANIRDW